MDYVTEIPLPGRTFAAPAADAPSRASVVALPTFVAGSENRLVAHTLGRLLAAAEADSAALGHRPRFAPSILALFGPTGVGKTHLARGLVEYWQQQRGELAAQYVSAADFRRYYHDALARDEVGEFRGQFRGCELLALDDLHQLPASGHVSQELRYTIDACEESGTTIIVTSTRAPMTLGSLAPDVRSRLAAGLLLQVAAPGASARTRIVRQASGALGRELSSEVAERLSAAISGPATAIFAALFEILAGPNADGTCDLQRIERLMASRSARRPTLREILTLVASHCRLPQKQIKSASRKQSAVFARELVVFLARELAAASYEQIGRALGGRDHTTIMHNYRKIQSDRQRYPEIQEAINELQRSLTSR